MQARTESRPLYSIIIPARDEAGAIAALIEELSQCALPRPFEIIVVDDGSADGTGDVVRALANPLVRLVRHDRSAGKSRAIRTGAEVALAPILLTVDGDGQNDPQYLPALVAPFATEPTVALVAGQRAARHDGWRKKAVSRMANKMRRALLADATRDTACGLKAMRREVFLALPFFDNNHRFYPALVLREGWQVAHVDVVDRPRTAGQSKYGVLDRALVGLPDMLGVWWLRRRNAGRPKVHEEMIVEPQYDE
ncbi:MAG: glycosyltransferase family 2 protein [Devosia sp.]